MNILLLGSGGRESAIAKKISESKETENFFISTGNPGMEDYGQCVESGDSFNQIGNFCKKNNINCLVVGPEQPLVEGISDYFKDDKDLKDIIVIGPSKKGALLEGSKDFAKEFMNKYDIPTARYKTFTKETLNEGKEFLKTLPSPYVLKADGLAGGKGVLIIDDEKEAEKELESMLCNEKFGKASDKVVIEEFLSGIECSVFVLTDGISYKILPEAKDYKRIGENDTGLNTGGMGSVSPVPFCTKDFMKKVENKIIIPTIKGLQKEDISYQGFIFLGLMNVNGNPYVIEYNVRMGDPETESVFPRIKSDIVEAFELIGKKKLSDYSLEIDNRVATTVMLVSGGYPEKYAKGKPISGLNDLNNCIAFHAGTKRNDKDEIVTNGGRVLALTCFGKDMNEALNKCYENAKRISWQDVYYRKDIGKDLMKY